MAGNMRSVQKVSDLFLSRQQGMSELPMQSVAAHTHAFMHNHEACRADSSFISFSVKHLVQAGGTCLSIF